MTSLVSKQIRLKNRPEGLPSAGDFELAEVAVPEIKDGEVLVQNVYMSVDPYMRGRMVDRKSYIPPFQIGQPLEGASVGRVVASRNDALNEGDYVLSMLGWRGAGDRNAPSIGSSSVAFGSKDQATAILSPPPPSLYRPSM